MKLIFHIVLYRTYIYIYIYKTLVHKLVKTHSYYSAPYLIYRSFTCFRFADDIYQFTYPGIGANLMYMALEGVALLFVMVLIEVCIWKIMQCEIWALSTVFTMELYIVSNTLYMYV